MPDVNLSTASNEPMDYVDPVYGVQRLPPIVRAIIRTKDFQRLRDINQLGVCHFVFEGANHTRYEHCLGVCHLVMRFLDILEVNTPAHLIGARSDPLVEFYKLCVILAGLLHDIGHGPFSHMWETFVHTGDDKHWAHENTSSDVVRHLFDTSNIRLSDDRRQHEAGVRLIVALIAGDENDSATVLGPKLHYMAEIVNNKFCLIDVDKWDYIVRDVYHLHADAMAMPIDRTFEQCFERARVVRLAGGDGRTHIAFHEHTLDAVRALFANRALMHRQCYQNVHVVGVEIVLRHVLRQAEHAGFRFDGGHKLTECHRNRLVYQRLTDDVLPLIEQSDDPRLRRAQGFTRLLRNRHLYSVDFDDATQTVKVCVPETIYIDDTNADYDRSLSYQLHLPDEHRSLPDRLILYGDDGWKAEVNPKTYTSRS